MRTTLDIDDDVLAAVKERARAEKRTAGEVLSDLARKALSGATAGQGGAGEAGFVLKGDWYVLPSRGGPLVTNELVKSIQDQIDREDLEHAIALGRKRASGIDG
ncbi:MAG: antitoxin [Pseudomonadota bacterium]